MITYKKYLPLLIGLSLISTAFAHDTPPENITRTSLIYDRHAEQLGYHGTSMGQFGTSRHDRPSSQPLAPNIVTGTRFNEQYINRQIALWSLRQINSSMPLIDDPWTDQVINDITAQMNAIVRTQSLIATPIINDSSINAFAVPGGVIGMNTGTILSAGELDEVASVIAHEIAHLSQRHYEHSQDNSKKLIALQIGGLLAALAASSVSGGVAAAAMIGSQTATAETAASHSREHEREADRMGQQILVQAGYDAAAMPRFFERLYKQVSLTTSKNAFVPSFIQSHPFTAERLSESMSRAKGYPVPSMIAREQQARLFDKLTWRLRYLTKQSGLDELTIHAKRSDGARLALIMYLADNARTDEALRLFANASFNPSDPLVCLTHAHVLTKMNDHAQAVSVLSSCQAIYPERRDLRLHLADAYVSTGETAKALALLNPLTERTPHDRQAWQGMQHAYEKSRMDKNIATIHALHARSQVELWGGKYDGALQSNAQATKVAKAHYPNLLPMLEQSKVMMIQARDYKP